uniref:Uncharacterized protein n=2 Tax=unclassified Caudoviricetes TaxID=2788787 RepID=A0A8S5MB40_9CAUD|nr:MAG TPA: hypothetical protein [Siphoviridae sp. ctsDY37]DAF96047.1 MAG TPA: hypothetical protein [Siphoviridae sp. cteLB10]
MYLVGYTYNISRFFLCQYFLKKNFTFLQKNFQIMNIYAKIVI